MSEQTNFDSKAKDWDQSEKRRRTISIIANKIKEKTKLDTNMHVMDFGAGTGLLTLELSPFVQQIIAVDTSQKMLGILKDKIETLKNNNISVLQLDIEHEKLSEVKVHLIVSSMTVHHLKNPGKVIQKLYDILLENGQLIIADLETTTNNSNDISDVTHRVRFKNESVKDLCLKAGFASVTTETLLTYTKTMKNGVEQNYSLFLISAQKEGSSHHKNVAGDNII